MLRTDSCKIRNGVCVSGDWQLALRAEVGAPVGFHHALTGGRDWSRSPFLSGEYPARRCYVKSDSEVKVEMDIRQRLR